MGTLSSWFRNAGVFNNASDITACVFMMILMIASAVQRWNRDIRNFLSGLVLLLSGICCGVLARALAYAHSEDGGPGPIQGGGNGPGRASGVQTDSSIIGGVQDIIAAITAPGNADDLIRTISFVFIYCSINLFFLQAVEVNGARPKRKGEVKSAMLFHVAIMTAGITLYVFTKREEVFVVTLMVLLIAGLYKTLKDERFVLRRGAIIASVIIPLITYIVSLIEPTMNFSGLALVVMYVFLYIEFHTYVELQLITTQAELAESRVRLMTDQISSHFVFNSLQSIGNMCETDPSGAKQAIDLFSRYLRGNLESLTAADMIPFEEELEHTKHYIGLEQMRDLHPFKVKYELETTEFMIPPLVLQPLVENAIKHGVKNCGADTITIAACIRNEHIVIMVSDNGTGQESPATSAGSHKSIALKNIKSRLCSQCGGTLNVNITPNGTISTIKLPYTGTKNQ